MSSEPEITAIVESLRNIIADENVRVGWKEYGKHIRRGGADDLAAQVSMEIARRAYMPSVGRMSPTLLPRVWFR